MATVFKMELGDRSLTLETGRLAGQANGAVLARYGDTVVLVTATMSKEPREGVDFLPLLVDYEERMYAIGKIPGGWGRREGKPGEIAILSARMIDRPLRPLFPSGFRNDVQVVATVLSVDQDNSPDIVAMIGASAALTISDIPFQGPIGGVHVGRVDGQLVINPTADQREYGDLDLTVAGTEDAVMMVEAGAKEVQEDDMLDAIMFGHEHIRKLVQLQRQMQETVGKEKVEVPLFNPDAPMVEQVEAHARDSLVNAIQTADKLEREEAIEAVFESTQEHFRSEWGEEEFAERAPQVVSILDALLKQETRRLIVEEKRRPDGRGLDEIREISCEVGILPRTHGSGLFTRGQTQVLTTCTLGVKSDEQLIEDLRDEDRKRYLHHYNFPPYSVGETRVLRGPGRREIGHGALAERALLPVIPDKDEFPYTIRLVSEVLESNGSTSQASVCGSTLALMDAGVPIKKPVAGIAMGLVKHGDDFTILTDIQGIEDALGDMDFKVAGTRDGITALQMDIKIGGVSRNILRQALRQAHAARTFILQRMLEVIERPRRELSPYAPRILTMEIPVDRIRDVIGPGGKTIRKIIDKTGVSIDIEDDGRVFIASADLVGAEQAVKMVEDLTQDVEVGATYLGKVKRTTDFGAFVEVLPGKEGLVHISKLAEGRVGKVEDVVTVGDDIMVKVTEIDNQGRINLSHKDALRDQGSKRAGRNNKRGRRRN